MSKRKKRGQPEKKPSIYGRFVPWVPGIVALQFVLAIYWVSRDTTVSPLHLLWAIIALACAYALMWQASGSTILSALALLPLGLTYEIWFGAANGSAAIFILMGTALLLWALGLWPQWAGLNQFERANLLVAGLLGGFLLVSYGQPLQPAMPSAILSPALPLYEDISQQLPLVVFGMGLVGLLWLLWEKRVEGALLLAGTAVTLVILYLLAPVHRSTLFIPLVLVAMVGLVHLLNRLAAFNPTLRALGWGALVAIAAWLFQLHFDTFL
jgi:hypothetical protein